MGKLPKMNEMSFLGGYLLNNLRVALSVNALILKKKIIWPITLFFILKNNKSLKKKVGELTVSPFLLPPPPYSHL